LRCARLISNVYRSSLRQVDCLGYLIELTLAVSDSSALRSLVFQPPDLTGRPY